MNIQNIYGPPNVKDHILNLCKICHPDIKIDIEKPEPYKRLIKKLIRSRDPILSTLFCIFSITCSFQMYDDLLAKFPNLLCYDYQIDFDDLTLTIPETFKESHKNEMNILAKKIRTTVKTINGSLNQKDLELFLPMATEVKFLLLLNFLDCLRITSLVYWQPKDIAAPLIIQMFDILSESYPDIFTKQTSECYCSSKEI
jgi:hypothetical protein